MENIENQSGGLEGKQVWIIKISEDRFLHISSIDDKIITYRNYGKDFEYKIEERDEYKIKDGVLYIYGATGNSKTWFDIEKLEPVNGMIRTLMELQIIK